MEFLPDPCNDRPMKDLPAFVNKAIDDKLLFPDGGIPDWQLLQEFLSKEGPIKKSQVMSIVDQGTELMKKEPNLVRLPEPIVVVGDIHG